MKESGEAKTQELNKPLTSVFNNCLWLEMRDFLVKNHQQKNKTNFKKSIASKIFRQ